MTLHTSIEEVPLLDSRIFNESLLNAKRTRIHRERAESAFLVSFHVIGALLDIK